MGKTNKILSLDEASKEFHNQRRYVIKDNTIGTRGYQKIAELVCTYDDLVHFFGEPIRLLNHPDRRVEWGFREETNMGSETGVGATIYDDNSGKWIEKDTPLAEVFNWNVGGSEDRSLEIIGQIFQQEMEKGKKFVSKPMDEDEATD